MVGDFPFPLCLLAAVEISPIAKGVGLRTAVAQLECNFQWHGTNQESGLPTTHSVSEGEPTKRSDSIPHIWLNWVAHSSHPAKSKAERQIGGVPIPQLFMRSKEVGLMLETPVAMITLLAAKVQIAQLEGPQCSAQQ